MQPGWQDVPQFRGLLATWTWRRDGHAADYNDDYDYVDETCAQFALTSSS